MQDTFTVFDLLEFKIIRILTHTVNLWIGNLLS